MNYQISNKVYNKTKYDTITMNLYDRSILDIMYFNIFPLSIDTQDLADAIGSNKVHNEILNVVRTRLRTMGYNVIIKNKQLIIK